MDEQKFFTFHHPLRTIRKDCVRHHSIKITVLQGREGIVRGLLDKLATKAPPRRRLTAVKTKHNFPRHFENTADYVRAFDELNHLKSTPMPDHWEHGYAQLDPTLPEMWEEVDSINIGE